MAYRRKTRDEYRISGNYGYGWDVECTEDTPSEARKRLKEYRENGGGRYKLTKHRVKI